MNTAIKVVGAAAKVAVIAVSAAKIYVCARLAYTIAKSGADNNNSNN